MDDMDEFDEAYAALRRMRMREDRREEEAIRNQQQAEDYTDRAEWLHAMTVHEYVERRRAIAERFAALTPDERRELALKVSRSESGMVFEVYCQQGWVNDPEEHGVMFDVLWSLLHDPLELIEQQTAERFEQLAQQIAEQIANVLETALTA